MTLHEMMRADRRHMRAAAFTSMMMRIIDKHLRGDRHNHEILRDISYELEDLCRREGIEILSDRMREDIGLPPRGPDGWTVEEILAMEERRLEMMRAPMIVQPLLATK